MHPEKNTKIRLLIVEDNQLVIQQYKLGLKGTDFELIFATDGENALTSYHQWQPDIILLDIMLPNMSGYSVLQEIRSKLRDIKTTVVMATALSDREDIIACARLGISGYIVKPFKPKEIGGLILSYYEKASQARP
jgi:DNA-binding response OmpR family regulator